MPSAWTISLQEFLLLVKAWASGHQRKWLCPILSWLFVGYALFLLPGHLLVLPPCLPPPHYLSQGPLKFQLFHNVLQPTGFSSAFSFPVSSRKLGLIILGLVHVNVPFLPQERKKLSKCPMVITHFLWILIGVTLALAAAAPRRACWKTFQERSAWANGRLTSSVLRGLTFFISWVATKAG